MRVRVCVRLHMRVHLVSLIILVNGYYQVGFSAKRSVFMSEFTHFKHATGNGAIQKFASATFVYPEKLVAEGCHGPWDKSVICENVNDCHSL